MVPRFPRKRTRAHPPVRSNAFPAPLLQPVLHLQPRDAREFGAILLYQRHVQGARVGGDQQVIRANQSPASLEPVSYVPVFRIRRLIKRHDEESGKYGLDLTRQRRRSALGATEAQFRGDDDAYCQTWSPTSLTFRATLPDGFLTRSDTTFVSSI